MRPDDWSARTWVLAACAGWAVLVALAGVFGLGGRIVPLPADPGLVQPLPRLPATPPERLGPLAQYADVGGRPLFSENRRPQPFFISGEEAAAPAFDLVLSSVLITPRLQLAIVQPAQGGEGLRVKVGESPAGFPAWRLAELAPRRAVFEGPEGRRELELRVFDGSGGQPPTTVILPSQPGAAAGLPSPAAVPPPGMPGARSTGGNSAPTAVAPPGSATPVQAPMPTPAGADAAVQVPPASADAQMELIRQRIEQRRAQLRQQQAQQQPTTPPAAPGKTQ